MVEITRESAEQLNTLLENLKDINARMTALEKKNDGTAYEKEVQERITKAMMEALPKSKFEEERKAIIDRLDAIETRLSRPAVPEGGKSEHEIKHREAILNLIATAGPGMMTPPYLIERRDLRIDSKTGAGFLVYPELRTQIIEAAREYDPIRQFATVEPTDSDAVLIPKRTAVPSFSWLGAEAGTATEDSTMAFGQVRVQVHEAMVYFDVTQKLLRSSFVNIEELLRRYLGEAKAAGEGAAFVAGTGAGEPEGITVNSGVIANKVTGSDVSIDAQNTWTSGDDAVDAFIAATVYNKEAYWANSRWLMNRTTLGEVLKLKDSEGRPLIGTFQMGQPLTILGYPVIISPNMPSMTNGTTTYPIVFGDLRRGYYIADSVNLAVQVDPYTQAANAIVRIYGYFATGGHVTDDDALCVIATS